jgi:hypothetical protein
MRRFLLHPQNYGTSTLRGLDLSGAESFVILPLGHLQVLRLTKTILPKDAVHFRVIALLFESIETITFCPRTCASAHARHMPIETSELERTISFHDGTCDHRVRKENQLGTGFSKYLLIWQ